MEDHIRRDIIGNVVTRINENIFISTVYSFLYYYIKIIFTAILRVNWKGGVLYNLSCTWMLRDCMMNQGMSRVE